MRASEWLEPVQRNNLSILRPVNKLRPTCSLLFTLWESLSALLQAVPSSMKSREETAPGLFSGAPIESAAVGWRTESDVAAAAAAAPFAVKFMLIESEAAATSTSFLPAQFYRLLFLRSSQPVTPPSSPKLEKAPHRAGQKNKKACERIGNTDKKEERMYAVGSFEWKDRL